jgi:hypothetical protein
MSTLDDILNAWVNTSRSNYKHLKNLVAIPMTLW